MDAEINDSTKLRKWAVFHLYIPIEKAKDGDISRLHEHISHHYWGKLNFIEDRELTEDTIDQE